MRLQKIQRRIKNKFIKKCAHKLKAGYFILLEAFGSALFFLARKFRIIPAIKPYLKEQVKKILVIRTDRIGDVLLSTPALRALREHFPDSFIGFLTTSYTGELLQENKNINELIIYNRFGSLLQKIRFIMKLRAFRFDLAVILYPVFESGFLAYLSKAAFRIGYPANGSGFLLTEKVDKRSLYKHEIETCLDVVRPIGVDTSDLATEFPLSEDAKAFAEGFFRENNILPSQLVICIHPGAYESHNRWLPQRYAKLAETLIAKYNARVILAGGRNDRQMVKSITNMMPEKPLAPVLNDSLQKLGAIIRRCDLFIGNNSGPMHVAAAVGTPVIALFGAVHPLEHENKWAPLGEKNIIVRSKMDCKDCHPGYCRSYKCMDMISVDDVLSAVDTQLQRTGKKVSA
ncbi:MAG: glycosyltransferase family 9 protein [Candidatus Omnitrophota bacterium]